MWVLLLFLSPGGNTLSALLASLLLSCSMHGSGLCLDKNSLGAEPLQPVTAPLRSTLSAAASW